MTITDESLTAYAAEMVDVLTALRDEIGRRDDGAGHRVVEYQSRAGRRRYKCETCTRT